LIDIPNRVLELLIPEEEFKKRMENFKPLQKEIKSPWLRRYTKFVASASKGAILEV
ncbi:MAG: dihydroxy-acid dehydratase, partial [Aquificaceae bacterium]|nr:dihydroxy-acid dehydratase [Aquificaceae bacterium]